MIVAPRQIEGVIVSLPALTEGPTVMDPDTLTPVQVFEAVPAAITVNVSTCALAFWYYIYMEHTKLRCSYSLYRITTVFRFLIICLVGCLDLSLPQTQFCIFVMMRCSHTTVSWYLLEYSLSGFKVYPVLSRCLIPGCGVCMCGTQPGLGLVDMDSSIW